MEVPSPCPIWACLTMKGLQRSRVKKEVHTSISFLLGIDTSWAKCIKQDHWGWFSCYRDKFALMLPCPRQGEVQPVCHSPSTQLWTIYVHSTAGVTECSIEGRRGNIWAGVWRRTAGSGAGQEVWETQRGHGHWSRDRPPDWFQWLQATSALLWGGL